MKQNNSYLYYSMNVSVILDDLYDLIDGVEWEPTGDTYAGPYPTVAAVLAARPHLALYRWVTVDGIVCH